VRSALEGTLRRTIAAAANAALFVAGVLTCAVALAVPPAQPATTAPTPTAHTAQQLTDAQIDAAIAKLKADPNFGSTVKVRRLRWNSSHDPDKPSADTQDGLRWIRKTIEWFANATRAVLWAAGVVLVSLLSVFIKRFIERRNARSARLQIAMPTHVRDLDIRPESLPDDIGATALVLWERGEHRAALALLYRGLLSRLTYVHGVPIRDSSTEGDCLELAAAHLPAERTAYVARLIRAWQRAVYGNIDPTPEELRSLCAGFAAAVVEPPETSVAEQAA
jgi:hypothetical protein